MASAIPLVARASNGDAAEPFDRTAVLAIYDARFAAGRAFGAQAAQWARVRSFSGDLTDLWFTELDRSWRERRLTVIGLTNHPTLICLGGFARDHGLRVAYQAEHRVTADGDAVHLGTGPAATLDALASAAASALPWERRVATVLASRPARHAPFVGRRWQSRSQPGSAGTLFSWAISPVLS